MTASAHKDEIPHLTGLRGYASVAVFIVHYCIILMPDLTGILAKITGAGRHGVVIFFVLSAYTIALSLDGKPFDPLRYAMRRFLRIAPAYYVVLTIALICRFEVPLAEALNTPFDFKSYLLHISFLNFLWVGHTENALGVESTLTVEAFYYLLIPCMIAASRTKSGMFLMFGIALILLTLPYTLGGDWSREAWRIWRWGPAPYAICFATGVSLYTHRRWIIEKIGGGIAYVVLFALAMTFMFTPDAEKTVTVPYYTLVSALCIIGGATSFGNLIFSNPVAFEIGRFSYSLYLVHLPIILVCSRLIHSELVLVAPIVLTTVATIILYFVAERPFRRLGKMIDQRMSASRLSGAAG